MPTAIKVVKTAADYSDEEIAEAVASLTSEFSDAVNAEPEPELELARALFAEACRPEPEEFANEISILRSAFGGSEFSTEVLEVMRISGHDDAAIAVTIPKIDGEPIRDARRTLTVFENGRWLDSECPEGRARFTREELGDLEPPTVPGIEPTPITADTREAIDYSDEEIAEAVVDLIREFSVALNAEPGPDLGRIKATYSTTCLPDDDTFASQIEQLRAALGGAQLSAQVVSAYRLPDVDHAALVVTIPLIDDMPVAAAGDNLLIFENGRWVDNNCEEGRAKFLDNVEPPVDDDSSSTTRALVPPSLSEDPSEHSDEDIARSVE